MCIRDRPKPKYIFQRGTTDGKNKDVDEKSEDENCLYSGENIYNFDFT